MVSSYRAIAGDFRWSLFLTECPDVDERLLTRRFSDLSQSWCVVSEESYGCAMGFRPGEPAQLLSEVIPQGDEPERFEPYVPDPAHRPEVKAWWAALRDYPG